MLARAVRTLCGRVWSLAGFWDYQWPALTALGWPALLLAPLLAAGGFLLLWRGGGWVRRRLRAGEGGALARAMGLFKWLLPAALLASVWPVLLSGVSLSPRWFEQYAAVAHAGGGVEGNVYTNSLEAFEENYAKGFRVFEGDLSFTSDGVLVLAHDWGTYYKKTYGVTETPPDPTPAYGDFMSTPLHGAYTAMDLPMVLELMARYEDMYFMTDFKDCNDHTLIREGFGQIVEAARSAGREDLLDRFVIQLYHLDFKDWVEEVYTFDNYLYTCYMTPLEIRLPEILIPYCLEEDIPVLTMWADADTKPWYAAAQPHNLHVYLHTVNDVGWANYLLESGAAGVYSDFVTGSEIITPLFRG